MRQRRIWSPYELTSGYNVCEFLLFHNNLKSSSMKIRIATLCWWLHLLYLTAFWSVLPLFLCCSFFTLVASHIRLNVLPTFLYLMKRRHVAGKCILDCFSVLFFFYFTRFSYSSKCSAHLRIFNEKETCCR